MSDIRASCDIQVWLQGDYAQGVRLSKKELKPYEARLQRSAALPKYDITIKPLQSAERQVA